MAAAKGCVGTARVNGRHMAAPFDFFFSSRRRHTRYWRDWSSDVCSSDLPLVIACLAARLPDKGSNAQRLKPIDPSKAWQIGRASCRERARIAVGGVAVRRRRELL